jgi:hypothetical protein
MLKYTCEPEAVWGIYRTFLLQRIVVLDRTGRALAAGMPDGH